MKYVGVTRVAVPCRRLLFFRVQVFSLQEKAEEVSSLVVAAEERLKSLDKCPFQASSMEEALASLQAGTRNKPLGWINTSQVVLCSEHFTLRLSPMAALRS